MVELLGLDLGSEGATAMRKVEMWHVWMVKVPQAR